VDDDAMLATGSVPDIDMPPLADMDAGKAHDQEGGEEEDPAIDICTDPEPEEEDTDGLSPGTRASWNATIAAHAQAPRPDNTFGSPFALQ